jgi:hypothetical protein
MKGTHQLNLNVTITASCLQKKKTNAIRSMTEKSDLHLVIMLNQSRFLVVFASNPSTGRVALHHSWRLQSNPFIQYKDKRLSRFK